MAVGNGYEGELGKPMKNVAVGKIIHREMDRPMKNVAVGRKTPGGAGEADEECGGRKWI